MVATLSVTDPDTNDSHRFILDGADADLFEVVGTQILVRGGAALDFETRSTLQLTVTVADAADNRSTEPLAVTLRDVAEASVLTATAEFGITENSPAGTVVGRFSAEDQDRGDEIAFSLSGPDALLFELTDTGEIRLRPGAELDYEAGPTRTFTITATDNTGLTDSETLTVQLVDENDVTPELSIDTLNVVAENSNAGTEVATFSVSDPDTNDAHDYALSGPDAALFALDGERIVVAAGADLDFEAGATRSIVLTATDAAGHATSETITVQLADLNDEAPELDITSLGPVREDLAVGQPVAQYAVTDADAGDSVTITLAGPDAGLFRVKNGNIALAPGQALDYEAGTSVTFDIVAADENDNVENSVAGTVVADLVTDDPDAGDTRTYALGGADSGLFAISGDRLVVKAGADIDFEEGDTREVTVTVTEAAGLSDTIALTVVINDLNDESPDLTVINEGPVAENSPAGTVAATFSATDADAGDTITYSLGGADAGFFEIAGNTVVFRAGAEPDFETKSNYSITVVARDAKNNTTVEPLTIAVSDLNEALEIDASNAGPIAENSNAGTIVGSFSHTDPDAGDTITYSLHGGDKSLFEISGTDIVLKSGVTFDFEAGATRTVQVRATDSGGLRDTRTVVVTLTDVNERPDLVLAGQTLIAEGSGPGTVVGTVLHNDPDAGDTIAYSLSGPGAHLFEIVEGRLVVAAGRRSTTRRPRPTT